MSKPFDPDRLIAIIGKQAAEIEALRVALKRLLLNYSAALPADKKDQRSIAEARRLLGLDDEQQGPDYDREAVNQSFESGLEKQVERLGKASEQQGPYTETPENNQLMERLRRR